MVLAAALLLMLAPARAMSEEVSTSARACAVMDVASGRLLLQHNAEEALPMASTTKVMTALLALERGNLSDEVTCSRNAFGVPGTSIYLSEGETLTLEQMLYGLMLQSGNDAAVAIAEHIGGSVSVFCKAMTERAAEIGCTNTVFLTPHGLPMEGHYTTAHDLALIAREAMNNPVFRQIVSTKRATIPWPGREYNRVLNNKNKLLSTYPGATGIKTGFTRAAGRCLVFGAERDGMEIVGVVLNCGDWFNEAARLMDKAFAAYEQSELMYGGETLREIPVTQGLRETVEAVLADDLCAAVPKNALPQLEIDLPESVEAPISAGDRLGEARLVWQGEVLKRADLVASADVGRDDYASRWAMWWRCWPVLPY